MTLTEFDLNKFSEIKDRSELKHSMFIQASAGTGKTYTITGIIQKLVKEDFELEKILVVTYTEKAAGELRDRIRKACPEKDVDNAPIFTIHSFCQKTLSEFSFTANQCANLTLVEDTAIDDFIDRWIRDVLIGDSQFKNLFESAEKQSSFINAIKKDFKHAISKYYLDNNNHEIKDIVSLDDIYIKTEEKKNRPSQIYTFAQIDNLLELSETDYASIKTEFVSVLSGKGTKAHYEKLTEFNKAKFYLIQLKKLYIAWQQEKENNKAQSYDDMLRSVREAVCNPACELKKQLQKKYEFAIIDEFQDTNQKQWDIFKTVFLEDTEHTLIVVGDPKQSIYAFQGADVNVYNKAISSIAEQNGLACKLSKNYRSTDKIVQGCNILFKNFFSPEAGITFSPSDINGKKAPAQYSGKEVNPFWIAGNEDKNITEKDFAKLTAQTIVDCCTWVDGKTKLQVNGKDGLRNVSFRDFAILVRSSSEFTETERSLKKAGIPFLRYKDANLFYGKECTNWISLFNAITAKDFTGHNRTILSEALFTDFFGIPIENIQDEKYDNPASPERQLIIQWQQLAQQRKWAKLLEKIFADTMIENRLSKLDKMQSLAKIRQIGNYAVDYLYKTDSSLEDVSKHLLRLSTDSDSSIDDGNIVEKATDFDCVQLMTIHASKGLEFPVVIVPAGLKARNPNVAHTYLYHDSQSNTKLSFSPYGKQQTTVEEDYERERIYYVAYTRASSILMLPLYDVWDPAVDSSKSSIYAFLRNNILALFEEKDDKAPLYVREVKDNNKKYEDLQNDVQLILKETKNTQAQQPQGQASENDFTEEQQLAEAKRLSAKIPSLILHKHSYSSLSHKKTAAESIANSTSESMTENGGRADKEGADLQHVSLAGFDATENPVTYTANPDSQDYSTPTISVPYNYPKGARLGIALHEVFEKADFAAAENDENIRRLITACFEKQTLSIPPEDPDHWLTYTSSILWNTLNAKLPEISGATQTGRYFSLCELAPEDRISEAEFNMNADLSDVLKNYCNGFIDLVFKRNVDGKELYSVLDWKSDSFEEAQYSDESVLKTHTDDRYSIQRVLYSYSLIKWLASFYKNETEAQVFENHFGGIYYAYVRGCHAGTCRGLYARTWKSWQELENAFKKILKDLQIAG